jgi:hypothetical protein
MLGLIHLGVLTLSSSTFVTPEIRSFGTRKRVWASVYAHRSLAKILGFCGISVDASVSGKPYRADGGLLFCIRDVRSRLPAHPPAGSCHPACLPARRRRPANTSGLNHELLSRALGIPGRLGAGPV